MGAYPSTYFTSNGGNSPSDIHGHDGQSQEGSLRLNEPRPDELIGRFPSYEHSSSSIPLPLSPLLQGSDVLSNHSSPSLYMRLHDRVALFLSKLSGPDSRPCEETKQDVPGRSPSQHSNHPSSLPGRYYLSRSASPVREIERSDRHGSPLPIPPAECITSLSGPERESSNRPLSFLGGYYLGHTTSPVREIECSDESPLLIPPVEYITSPSWLERESSSCSSSPERELSSLSPSHDLKSLTLPPLLERKHSSRSPSPKLNSSSLPPSLKHANFSPFPSPRLEFISSPSLSESEYSSHSSLLEAEYFSCPSSPELKVPSPELVSMPASHVSPPLAFDTNERSSHPWLCNSFVSSIPSDSGTSDLPIANAVNKATPTPLLTDEVVAMGDDAIIRYEIVRIQQYLCPPEVNPFSLFSLEELEIYYAAAVDTKNILQLRKALVKADIGDSLELLVPKLSLYARDNATLANVLDELKLIKDECCNRKAELDFHALESLRYMLPLHQPSPLETHDTLFSTLTHALEQKDAAQQAAHHFMKDPSALVEHCLPQSGTAQR